MKRIFLIICIAAMTTKTYHATAQETKQLNAKEQSVVTIAAFTAIGNMPQLHTALNNGLDAGLTINEIKEVLVQLYAYAGFPRSLNALNTFMVVLKERKNKGITDQAGKEPSSLPTGKNRLEFGTEMQTKLIGQPVKGEVYEFAPVIDRFLKEHLFGDIFGRDNLDWKTREIATISALASLDGTENQLRSHINVGKYNGLTETQLTAMFGLIKKSTGKTLPAQPAVAFTQNRFTLVYEGAITENIKGKVNIHPVTYKIKDITIAANIYTPANYSLTMKYPAIIIAHPNGGVKEQVAGLYAQRLAEQGFITITADAAYQGGSGGLPRYIDKPANRIEDIYAMADFISQYKGVDTARLVLLGICGGGGYSLKAAQADKRFKAIATVSMFNSGLVRRNGFMNSQLSTIQERLKKASAARASETAGGEVLYALPETAPLTDEQIDKLPFELYREGSVYYGRTHRHANASSNYTMSSLMDLMTFDANTNTDLIDQPLLMIAGSKADTKYMTDEVFAKATHARTKELFLIEGATHIETYWKAPYVSQAVNKLVNFYQANF